VPAWSPVAKIVSPTPAANDDFGFSVAVSGTTIAIGAPGAAGGRGAVLVYQLVGGTWTYVQTLADPSAVTTDGFGTSVAIAGTTLAAGATGDSSSAGAVYVYTRSGATWTGATKLPATPSASALLGASLAMSATTIVAGAPSDTSGGAKGAAWVFTGTGASWTVQKQIANPNAQTAERFGGAIDIDVDTLVVGAPFAACGTKAQCGAAYVFARSGTTWGAAAPIAPPSPTAGAFFGSSVGVDRIHLVIGQSNITLPTVFAYVYRFATSWSVVAQLPAAGDTLADRFGAAACIDGYTIVVGSPSRSANGAFDIFE
jgi:hypothetical protein